MTEFFPDEDNAENIKLQAERSVNVSEELIGSVLRYVHKNYPDLLE